MLAKTWKTWNPVHCSWECKMLYSYCGNRPVAPQKVLHTNATWPSNSNFRYILRRTEHRDSASACVGRPTATLLTIAEGANELCHTHMMEYHSAVKGNEVLTHATMRMNLKNILNERIQTRRSHILQFHWYETFNVLKSIEIKSCRVVAGA